MNGNSGVICFNLALIPLSRQPRQQYVQTAQGYVPVQSVQQPMQQPVIAQAHAVEISPVYVQYAAVQPEQSKT